MIDRNVQRTALATRIKVAPMPAAFLTRARAEGVDDLGQPVKRTVARGGEPCRDVLRRARPGERLILASFSPFSKPGPYHEYGPVFIFENAEPDAIREDELPPIDSPDDYLREQFVIRAYSADEEILDAELTRAADIGLTIDRFFDSPATSFLHVRFPTYGCFALRIDRA
jgi:Protein of unknown function (DUF1203)